MNYKLTENKKVFNGETLFQIECIEDCKYAKVGELGGYIASYDNLADGAWVNKDVCVCDTSLVKGYMKGGFVACDSVVEGNANGAIISSYVDESSELDYAIMVDSKVINTKHKAECIGLHLSVAFIMLSKIIDSELIGSVMILASYIEESTINWNNVEYMDVSGNLGVLECLNEETGEMECVEYGKERFVEVNEDLKKEWEMNMGTILKGEDVQTDDEEADKLFNENKKCQFKNEEKAECVLSEVNDMGEYYKDLFGEVVYGMLIEQLNYKK